MLTQTISILCQMRLEMYHPVLSVQPIKIALNIAPSCWQCCRSEAALSWSGPPGSKAIMMGLFVYLGISEQTEYSLMLWRLFAFTWAALQGKALSSCSDICKPAILGVGYSEGGARVGEGKQPKSLSLHFTELPDSLAGLIIQFRGCNP